MKLIDANKLCMHFNDWRYAESPKDKTGYEPLEYTCHDMQSMIYRTIGDAMRGIDEQQTIEAIPIEWIEKYNHDEDLGYKSIRIKAMIDVWREENE